jgi:hypothetical protein
VFASEGSEITKTPARAPQANATAERSVRSPRVECLHWLLILNQPHLEHALGVFKGSGMASPLELDARLPGRYAAFISVYKTAIRPSRTSATS